MAIGLVGKKVGMDHIFDEQGNFIPVTVIKAGPCTVIEIKKTQKDGYNAVKLCFEEVDNKKEYRYTKPVRGIFSKKNIPLHKVIKEFKYDENEELTCNNGDILDVNIFSGTDYVDVVGITKGKGFAGVIKKYNFRGGPKTHGSHFQRSAGSIGQCATPSRVHKGKKMPGRMGGERQTIQNIKIVDIDSKNGLISVLGSVPGRKRSLVYIRKAIKKKGNKIE